MSDRAFLLLGYLIMAGFAITAAFMLGYTVPTIALGKVYGFGAGVMAYSAFDMGRDVRKLRSHMRNGGRQ